MGEAESEVNHVSNTSKIVTSGSLLYLADEAIKHMCWRVNATLLFY